MNNSVTHVNSFNPGSNFAFKLAQPNKELMLNRVIQQRLVAPSTWGQVSVAPKYTLGSKWRPQVYVPPFDKSDFWIQHPEGFIPRTPAPFN
tara:strand:- start:700 stop:972 length:273 start_codon:yes stop_codon:yes gene_type:complete